MQEQVGKRETEGKLDSPGMEKSQDLLGLYLANSMAVVITINFRSFMGGVNVFLGLGGLV